MANTLKIKNSNVALRVPTSLEDGELAINFHDGKPINISLPNQIDYEVKETDAALKGQTVSSSYKPAKLDNDLNVQVPPFIEAGDKIVIDTRTLEYVKKL